MSRDQVGEDHVFGAQARGLDDAPAVLGARALQHRERMGDPLVEAGRPAGVQVDGAQMPSPALTNSGAGRFARASAVPSGFAKSGSGSSVSPW